MYITIYICNKVYKILIYMYRMGRKTGPPLKVYDSCIWWRKKAFNTSKSSALYWQYDWCSECHHI